MGDWKKEVCGSCEFRKPINLDYFISDSFCERNEFFGQFIIKYSTSPACEEWQPVRRER